MKKILFIGLTALIGFNASAQYKQQMLAGPQKLDNAKIKSFPSKEGFKNSNKKTRGGSIYLNYIEFVAAQEGILQATLDANSSLYYCFPDSNVRYNPPNQGYGMQYKSIGQVLDPNANVIKNNTPSGEIFIGNNTYTVDSIFVLGSYAKVSAAVDTLIMSVVHSGAANMPVYYFTGATATNYGTDTVRFASQDYNPALFNNAPYQVNVAGAPAAYTVKRPLTNADSNNYTMGANSYNLKYLGFSANAFNVPANEKVSVSFTFKPGYTWIAGDTIGSFNKWLFLSYEPNGDNTFMPYYAGDYNMSSNVYKDSTGWEALYVPTLAWTAPYSPEIHDIVWKLTCNTCGFVNTNDLSENMDITVSPNPVSDNLNFNFSLNNTAKNVTISLTNLVGQQVKNIQVGAVSANNAQNINLSVSDLPTGLYIYTIQVDGEKLSNKVLVK
ncbi:MAG TPA: T9SS type A sorting domain-containing protein [Chitinophagaceae bacterium]|nr:T9SS type A sorting domain-containing protein [Chitinophagaceae bacterium]